MPSVCFYFQVHQPFRLKHYTVFDKSPTYFDSIKNEEGPKKKDNAENALNYLLSVLEEYICPKIMKAA